MDASVVIPTHNRREGLTGLLADLRAQSVDAAFEVVVVDSAAGEDIGDVVAAAADGGLTARRVLTENSLARKRNAGAAAATGEIVCFLDDDMRVPPGWLAAHLAAHAEAPSSCISGDVRFPDEWVAASNYYRYKQAQHHATDGADLVPVPGNRVVAMNLSLPRELWDRVGGNDEDFTRYGGEDVEFGFRVARAGIPTLLAPAAWAWHREVKQDVVGFCAKLYQSAYEGAPLVLAKAPEAASVRTFRWTEPGLQRGFVDQVAHAGLRALARPAVVVRMARALQRSDADPRKFSVRPYQALTALVNQLAVDDRVAGRPNRARELFA